MPKRGKKEAVPESMSIFGPVKIFEFEAIT